MAVRIQTRRCLHVFTPPGRLWCTVPEHILPHHTDEDRCCNYVSYLNFSSCCECSLACPHRVSQSCILRTLPSLLLACRKSLLSRDKLLLFTSMQVSLDAAVRKFPGLRALSLDLEHITCLTAMQELRQ